MEIQEITKLLDDIEKYGKEVLVGHNDRTERRRLAEQLVRLEETVKTEEGGYGKIDGVEKLEEYLEMEPKKVLKWAEGLGMDIFDLRRAHEALSYREETVAQMIENFRLSNASATEEIEEIRGAMTNEQIWLKGASNDEERLGRLQNIADLTEYLSRLKVIAREEDRLTEKKLAAIKEFAADNFGKDEPFTVDVVMPETGEEVACSNPWYDRSARFPLNDAQAVEEWGFVGLYNYIAEASKQI